MWNIVGIFLVVLAGHLVDCGAQTLTTLYQFGGVPTDGARPNGLPMNTADINTEQREGSGA